MNEQVKAADAEQDLTGIEEMFHPVVQKYGRSMFALVMNAGVAGEAMQRLGRVIEHHRSQHGMHAVQVLGQAFNQVSNAYVLSKGWDEGTLAQCGRDIQLAFAGKLSVVEAGIILPGH